MNQELQEFILNTLKQGKDFVFDQAPDMVQQYIKCIGIENGIGAIFSLIAICTFIYMIFRGTKTEPSCRADDGPFLIKSIGTIGLIFSSLLFFISLSTALKIVYYPKGYLLEQVLNHSK